MTDFVQGLILGAVQGVTEWLPISSEGVNTLVQINLFDEPVPEAIAISIWLHLGTLLAAIVYFRRELWILIHRFLGYVTGTPEGRRFNLNVPISFLVISTLLTGVLGAPLFVYGLNEKEIPAMEMTMIIGGLLIVTGILQRFTAGFAASRTRPGTKDAVLLGAVQALSVFPGLSRSGLTVSAFLFRGYEAIQAIRLSFLMSIPVVLAAEIGLGLIDGIKFNPVVVAGVLTAFVFGLLTISLLIRIATRVAFWKFCVVLGVISLLSPLFA